MFLICLIVNAIITTPNIATVSFTKNAEKRPIPITKNANNMDGEYFDLDIILIENDCNTPDLSKADIILNIPKRNPMTWKFIASKVCCILIVCVITINKAPIDIEIQIGILNFV